jgi:hypothetical protein
LIVTAADALGPAGSLAALAIIATLVGGTTNFILAFMAGIASLAWRPREHESRNTRRREVVDLLMGWATPTDLVDHAEWSTEWQEAQRIRGEGLTRVTTFIPLVVIVCTLGLRLSHLYWLAIVFALFVLGHGIAALIHSSSMYDDLRRKREQRINEERAARAQQREQK